MRSLVTSFFLYACESWTPTIDLQRRIQAMGMKCYHKILCISYKDLVTNEEVRTKVQQAVGPHEDPLTTVKRRKLQWYVHVSHSSGLPKAILQGTVKGGRRQGRQKKWGDNLREWIGLEFAKSQRAVENRGKWKNLVWSHHWSPTSLAIERSVKMVRWSDTAFWRFLFLQYLTTA